MLGADPVVPGAFADIGRHDGIVPVPGVLIVRPDAPLFYANAELVRDAIEQAVGSARAVVLVLDGNDNLDITSAEQLGKLADGLAARNVPLGWPTYTARPWRWPNGPGCSPRSAPVTSSRPRPPPWPGRSR
jgi:MFS superfamily sulfate permease-like transporter